MTNTPNLVSCVLVVDDSAVNRLLASELLRSFSLSPILAADGAEAVALASALRLDLILMDLQMPVLGGLAATRQIRQFERTYQQARVPVVAYTSSAPALQVLHECGIDGLLEKPCNADALRYCLQEFCPQLLHPTADLHRPNAAMNEPYVRAMARGGDRPLFNGPAALAG